MEKLTNEQLSQLTEKERNQYFLALLNEQENTQSQTIGNISSGSTIGLTSYNQTLQAHENNLKPLVGQIIQFQNLKSSCMIAQDGKDLRRQARKMVNSVINLNRFTIGEVRKSPIILRTSQYDIHVVNVSDGQTLIQNPCRYVVLLNISETLKTLQPSTSINDKTPVTVAQEAPVTVAQEAPAVVTQEAQDTKKKTR